MGAFFLFNKDYEISVNDVISDFQKRGFNKEPKIFDLGNSILILFKKWCIDINNFLIHGENAVYAVGTIIYKKLSYNKSLQAILNDFILNRIDSSQLIGNYFLLFKRHNRLSFLHDPLSTYNVYTTYNHSIVSSSFLAILVD